MTIQNRIEVPYPQEFREEIFKMLGYRGYRKVEQQAGGDLPTVETRLQNLVDYRWDSRIL
jgi:hypothetical protein